jgi:hypothetical protein
LRFLNNENTGIITPTNTNIGPKVIPRNPKPNGSESKVIIKNPINMTINPVIKIRILLESSGKADLFEELFILKKIRS